MRGGRLAVPVDRRSLTTIGEADRRLVTSRRWAATGLVPAGSRAVDRIATAPAGYLLAHQSSDIARHGMLLSSLPSPGEARLVVTPGRKRGEWHLDVASRDRSGLLAAFTGALARASVEVAQGVVATWDDGAALQAFIVRSARLPDQRSLQLELETSLGAQLSSPAVADASFTFDGEASRLYTSAGVVAADRPGLLHALAVAIATAGVDVHAARVDTVDGLAYDHFDLSDRWGHKLGAKLEECIRTAVLGGVSDGAVQLRPGMVRGPRDLLSLRRTSIPAGHR